MGRSEYDKDGFVYYGVNKKPQGNITFFIYTHTHTHTIHSINTVI